MMSWVCERQNDHDKSMCMVVNGRCVLRAPQDSCVCGNIMCPQRNPNLISIKHLPWGLPSRRCIVRYISRGATYYCNAFLVDGRCEEHGAAHDDDDDNTEQRLSYMRLGVCRWVLMPDDTSGGGLYKGVQPAHTEYSVSAVSEQPAPQNNDQPAVWGLVLKDMVDRDAVGRKRYGTPLQPHNGRDALRDAYEEALDLVVYLRQAIYERDNS